ncbi:unnamed protein product [Allacma fusca]|uniref:P-type domain-containing protein n=1 Tax=Allacma fusca TaxID=39272 RepID=A0A8J2JME1_9HEXA|nr:unnamed protein product [Allacma fusca]
MKNLLLLAVVAVSATLGVAQQCLPYTERIDCHPGPFTGNNREECIAMGCTFCDADVPDWNVPVCYLPKSYGYKMDGQPEDTGNGFRVTLKRATSLTMFGSDSETITLEVFFQSDYRLRIKVTDGTSRYEVPLQVDPAQPATGNRLYDVEFSNDPVFAFKVIRKATGTVIFDTSLGGLTFSDQFLQISTRLASKNLYGIGENEQLTFRHNFDKFPVFPLFTKDTFPDGNANMYGVHPQYTVLEEDGNAHSVLFVNSNAQEFVVLPAPGLLHRTIGGIIDIYIFLGPTPENTAQQYTEAIGRTPIPPYWALGFQLCKYGYDNLETMKAVVDRTLAAQIPQDVQYGDIDIMDGNKDFTVSQDRFGGLPAYVRELKAKGVKFMTILDPAIALGEAPGTYRAADLGKEMGVFLNNSDGTIFEGRVWPSSNVGFPDFSKNATREWWITMIKEFHDLLEFDALWIDMNEPDNFGNGDTNKGCPNNKYNNPPYVPKIRGDYLPTSTLCMDIEDSISLQYNTHSLYGWLESEPTAAGVLAATGKRPYVFSRSTYVGTGRWASHWLGDNYSKWRDIKTSIIGTLQFNQFGVPFVGPDICGHQGHVEEELCQRWHELGAFYPFSRNHNAYGMKDQDPASFGPAVAESTKKALEIRYTYLPYLYTLFFYHYTQGSTVFRALWHEFPTEIATQGIDTQFLLGPGFMVSPALNEGQRSVNAYFPNTRWFNLREGTEVNARGTTLNLNTPLDTINLHLRGGIIYPTQEPALNTELARRNDIGITIALDDNNSADGRMYNDDGDMLNPTESGKYYLVHHTYANGELISTVENNGYPRMAEIKLDTIRILGAPQNLSTATGFN